MAALIFLFVKLIASLFKSKRRLEAENVALRRQLIVLQRKIRGRVEFTNHDRLFIQLYHWFPSVPSRSFGQRPRCAGIVPVFAATGAGNLGIWEAGRKSVRDLRALIRRMSMENLL